MRLGPGSRGAIALTVVLACTLLTAGCAARADDELVVFAAASLRPPLEQMASQFQAAHPGVVVTLQTGGSFTLAAQVVEGAPVDVFVSAGPGPMETARRSGRVSAVTPVASNTLVLVTPNDNPAGLDALDDLARPDVSVALCQPAVPCGALAAQVLDRAGLSVAPASWERDVTSVLTKVRMGEVDAGLVYLSDVGSAGGEVHVVDDPRVGQLSTSYTLAVLTDASPRDLAQQFGALVVSDAGQALLADHGFGPP